MTTKNLVIYLCIILGLCLSTSAALTDGLISHYSLDTSANDTLGVNNCALLNTAAISSGSQGVINEGMQSSAANDEMRCTSFDFTSTPQVTITFWMNRTSSGNNLRFMNYYKDANNRFFFAASGASALRYYLVEGGTVRLNVVDADKANYKAEEFYAVILNNTNFTVYVNATKKYAAALAFGLDDVGDGQLAFGAENGADGSQGIWDEIGVWNRTLSQAEITTLWASGSPITYPWTGGTTFTLTATDSYNATSINEFNVTMVNITGSYDYNTTGGSIAIQNLTGLYNITFYATDYEPKYYSNYNVSSNLAGSLNYAYKRVNVTVNSSINGTAISNFTLDYFSLNSSDSGSLNSSGSQVFFYSNTNETYNFTINAAGFATHTVLETITTNSIYNYTLYPTNSLQIYVYNEINNTLMSANVTLEMISAASAINYTIENGTRLIQNITAGDYTLRFEATNYAEKFYYLTINDLHYYTVNLYLLPTNYTSNCVATVYNEYSDYVEGATVKMLKYFTDTNSYQIVDMIITNFEGQGVLSCELNTEFYKFIIEYDSEIFLETSPSYIYDTELTFQINLQDTTDLKFFSISDLVYDLTFNNVTNNFRYVWSNAGSTVVQACLNVYETSGINDIAYNASCVSAASGTILLGVSPTAGSQYKAVATVYFIPSDETYIDTIFKHFNTAIATHGNEGLFYLAIFILLFGLVGLWNPVVGCILIGFPPLLFDILQLTEIGKTICVGWLALWQIIAYAISDKA